MEESDDIPTFDGEQPSNILPRAPLRAEDAEAISTDREGGDGGHAPAPANVDASAASVAADRALAFERLVTFLDSYFEPSSPVTKWKFLDAIGADPRTATFPDTFTEELVQVGFGPEELSAFGLGDEIINALTSDNAPPQYLSFDFDSLTVSFCPKCEDATSEQRTVRDMALERNLLEVACEPTVLYVVQSQADVDVLRRLGLTAIMSDGLEGLTGDDVRKIFPSNPRDDLDWQYHLVLVDFDVANLANGPLTIIDTAISQLSDAADLYGIDPTRRFGVCRLTNSDFERLKYAHRFEDSRQVRELLETWATRARKTRIVNWRAAFETREVSFSEAVTALEQALVQPDGLLRLLGVQAAEPRYRAKLEKLRVEFCTLVDQAAETLDHFEQTFAGDMVRELIELDPRLQAAAAVLADPTAPVLVSLDQESIRRRLEILQQIRRIVNTPKTRRRTR